MRLLRLLTLVGSLDRLRRLGPLAFGKSLLGPMSLLGLLASSPAARAGCTAPTTGATPGGR